RRRRDRGRSRRHCRGESRNMAERRGADADATGGELATAEAGCRASLRRPRCGKSAGTRALRGHLFARISCARVDLAVLRARALQGCKADGMDALSGRLSAARGAFENPEARTLLDYRAPRAGLGLLRPQWRR